MRVYISGDIEGVTGVVNWAQCEGPQAGAADWDFARRMYTHDINAAIRGAKAGGASEVVVKDSHGTCRNLLIDQLEPGTELLSGYGSGAHGMMEGIQHGFDAAFLVGYHGRAGQPHGMMEHALAGALHRFWINDIEAGEILASAAVAGAFGVPLVLVTSDQVGCDEATAQIPGVQVASVKTGLGRYMGRLKHPSITGPLIERAAADACRKADQIQPVEFNGRTTMRLQFRDTAYADYPESISGVKRIDGYTIEWQGDTFLEAHTAMYQVFAVASAGQRGGAG